MTPRELELMKELAAAGRQGRTIPATSRSGLGRMIEKHYVAHRASFRRTINLARYCESHFDALVLDAARNVFGTDK